MERKNEWIYGVCVCVCEHFKCQNVTIVMKLVNICTGEVKYSVKKNAQRFYIFL